VGDFEQKCLFNTPRGTFTKTIWNASVNETTYAKAFIATWPKNAVDSRFSGNVIKQKYKNPNISHTNNLIIYVTCFIERG